MSGCIGYQWWSDGLGTYLDTATSCLFFWDGSLLWWSCPNEAVSYVPTVLDYVLFLGGTKLLLTLYGTTVLSSAYLYLEGCLCPGL